MPWRTRCGSPRRCRRRRRSSWASRAVVTRTSTWSPRPWGRRSGDAGSRHLPGEGDRVMPAPAAGRPSTTSRLEATFARLRGRGERALVTYFTAGDPSLADTRLLVVEAERRGADVVELGVPFSDPLADGPVIQRAAMRALAGGTTVLRVLETVATLRAEVSVPLVLLTYYNPLLAFGLKAFARTAAGAGVDGAIVADLPPEEADPLATEADPAGLDLIHLVAPTPTAARVRLI